ncbi:hypothetical protein B0A48_12953 [Cryoendolithus antarcticus]|uniref:Uncharacterized protein n=1 Tax=Cryoendolithus antarcticus TaxID=1507870 RepID=A0A1V8SQU4_9PEZI|nr:hypothetical protein B0A48_12953 [Cryoendolithus antarcticus]
MKQQQEEYEYDDVPQDEDEALRSASRTPLLHSPRSERYLRSSRLNGSPRPDDNEEPAENTGVITQGEQQIEEQFSPYFAEIREIGSPRSAGPSGSDENRRPTGGRGNLTDFDEEMIEMQELNSDKPPVDSKMVSNNASAAALLNKVESAPGAVAQGRAPAEATAAEQDQEHVRSYSLFNRSPPNGQLDRASEVDQVSDTTSYDSAERQAAAEAAAESMLAPLPGQRAPWERPPVRRPVVHPAVADDLVEDPLNGDEPVESPSVEDESLADQSIHEADAERSNVSSEFQAVFNIIRAIGNAAIRPDFGPAPVADDPAAEQLIAPNSVLGAGSAPATNYLSTLARHHRINAIDSPSVESADPEPPNIFSPTSAALGRPWIIRPPGTSSVAIARPAPAVTSTAWNAAEDAFQRMMAEAERRAMAAVDAKRQKKEAKAARKAAKAAEKARRRAQRRAEGRSF